MPVLFRRPRFMHGRRIAPAPRNVQDPFYSLSSSTCSSTTVGTDTELGDIFVGGAEDDVTIVYDEIRSKIGFGEIYRMLLRKLHFATS